MELKEVRKGEEELEGWVKEEELIPQWRTMGRRWRWRRRSKSWELAQEEDVNEERKVEKAWEEVEEEKVEPQIWEEEQEEEEVEEVREEE